MIELKEITWKNIDDVFKLKVAKDQEGFVASNAYSLAQAYCSLKEDKYPDTALAIAKGDKIVGFLMYEYVSSERDRDDEDLQEGSYYHLFRYMIGEEHQGKGYGKEAMKRLIDHIKKCPQGPADAFFICYCPENIISKAFYESFGFSDTGQVVDGENITKLSI